MEVGCIRIRVFTEAILGNPSQGASDLLLIQEEKLTVKSFSCRERDAGVRKT